MTLIWASLERSFPPAEVEYQGCQFWLKVMTSEVEERPKLVTAGYGWHRSQWVKLKHILGSIEPNHRKDKCEHLLKFCLCFNYSQAHKHWKVLTLI